MDICLEADILAEDLQRKCVRRVYNYKTSGRVEYDEFYMKLSKPIIDEIDKVLAKHYGFTEEELDFIINYDIKYRMGDELNEEGESSSKRPNRLLNRNFVNRKQSQRIISSPWLYATKRWKESAVEKKQPLSDISMMRNSLRKC